MRQTRANIKKYVAIIFLPGKKTLHHSLPSWKILFGRPASVASDKAVAHPLSMKKKSTSQSAFFRLRSIPFLLCVGIACSVLTGTLLAFIRAEAPAKVSYRTLTFAERVDYQRAIEEVYWRHRIWPKERPDPKPSLDEVIPSAQLEKKVEDYLRNSQALEDYWQQSLSAEQLEAEMERMAQHTKQPEVLRELFEALGNDPFVIAECLARPALSERRVNEFHEMNPKPATEPTQRAAGESDAVFAGYSLPVLASNAGVCTDNTWSPLIDVPARRSQHAAVW